MMNDVMQTFSEDYASCNVVRVLRAAEGPRGGSQPEVRQLLCCRYAEGLRVAYQLGVAQLGGCCVGGVQRDLVVPISQRVTWSCVTDVLRDAEGPRGATQPGTRSLCRLPLQNTGPVLPAGC